MACSHKNESVFTPKLCFGKMNLFDSVGVVSHMFLTKNNIVGAICLSTLQRRMSKFPSRHYRMLLNSHNFSRD